MKTPRRPGRVSSRAISPAGAQSGRAPSFCVSTSATAALETFPFFWVFIPVYLLKTRIPSPAVYSHVWRLSCNGSQQQNVD
jgi:hypothetical protein